MSIKSYTQLGAAMIEVAMLAKDNKKIRIGRWSGRWIVEGK